MSARFAGLHRLAWSMRQKARPAKPWSVVPGKFRQSAKRSMRREGVAVRRPLQSSGRMTPTGTMSTRLATMSRGVSFPFTTPTTRDGRRLYSTEHAKRVVDEAILNDFMASLPRHEQPERRSGKIAKAADHSAH